MTDAVALCICSFPHFPGARVIRLKMSDLLVLVSEERAAHDRCLRSSEVELTFVCSLQGSDVKEHVSTVIKEMFCSSPVLPEVQWGFCRFSEAVPLCDNYDMTFKTSCSGVTDFWLWPLIGQNPRFF